MTVKPDYKRYGFIPQRQQGQLIMRLRNQAGDMTSEGLHKLADLAEKFGNGQVHMTLRQGVEIPGVREERFEEALQAIADAGLLPAVCGLRVRPVVSCPGNATCPYGLMNTKTLAKTLDEQFVGRDVPAKTKFAISGCANACTKPQGHDIGFRGAVEPLLDQELCITCGACVKRCPAKAMTIENKTLTINYDTCLSCGVCTRICPKQALKVGQSGYHIFIGGKGGRYANEAALLTTFVPEDKIISYLEAILKAYQEMADKGQRLSAVLLKNGIEAIKNNVAEKL
jgi:anaerobic sulfite reductase subunit C